ncbi:MAG: glycoside hydrolase family 15 protein, partial [Acidobacteria bacterium]
VLKPTDQKVKQTMQAIEQNLWIKTEIGGIARYENDGYMRVSEELPGNPWIICTLWLANYHIAIASSPDELKRAGKLIDLVTNWALPSGVLSEQINPLDGSQISVAPLTWSHAEFITTITKYVEKSRELVATFGEEVLSGK